MKKKRPPLFKKLYTRFGERWRSRTHRRHSINFKRTTLPNIPETLPLEHKGGITAILTVYKRPGYLPKQIAALQNQTVPPIQVWLWCNHGDNANMADFSAIADRVIVSNHNWKFFGRFALANLVQTDYVALFDDDILPQPRWLENCLHTVKNGYDGILGGSGVILPASGGYSSNNKAGWNGKQSTETVPVDLVGHAWFMKTAHLRHFWREPPYSWDNGEDIHLSYTALKYGNIRTYVPPHPPNDKNLWSCDPDFGKIAGGGKVATYKKGDHMPIRDSAVRYYQSNGWITHNELKNP